MSTGQPYRLERDARVARRHVLNFTFNGQKLTGLEGDTLASALLANGIKVVGRSFKLRRPRGIMAAGAEEANAIMQIGSGDRTIPNPRATQVQLFEGLEARSTKGWPSAKFDLGGVNDLLSSVLSAGFYYKTFMYPRRFWDLYERVIRAMAGFGTAPDKADPDEYEQQNLHCDVLVVGAGPSGLMAALSAGRSGARVLIADEQNELGGSLLSAAPGADGDLSDAWLAAQIAELEALENVRILPRTTAFGYFDHNFLTLAERCHDHLPVMQRAGVRERLWRVRARQVVLAQGAFERPLAFGNNDRPGVMLASAVSSYVNRYAVKPGDRAVVFTNNDSAYQTAIDLHSAGITVAAVIDARPEGPGEIKTTFDALGIPLMAGHVVCDVIGRQAVKGVQVGRRVEGASETDIAMTLRCDLVAVSGGWSPAVHLHSQAAGQLDWDEGLKAFLPRSNDAGQNISVGAGHGIFSLKGCLESGVQGGAVAATRCGFESVAVSLPELKDWTQAPLEALWSVPAAKTSGRPPKQFVDFQNDTSVSDIRLAVREGFESVEHVKRYTALGFGTDQGKLGNINGMAILAEALGSAIPEVGTTTFRPAYTPTSFAVCASESVKDLYEPTRTTAINDWHQAQNAPHEVVGQWLRPWYFPHAGEDMAAAVSRECRAARQSVAMMDASTLGKIDVQGPDATEFLNRMYTHDVDQMSIGRCAYGLLLGEDGMVMDDGVMARLGPEHYYLTTTTGGAANVLSWLELWLQTEWPDLKVHLTSLTDQYSTIAVVGPKSRAVLENLDCSEDLSASVFPFMTVKPATLNGIRVQLFRVSFSGELAFEVNVDSRYAAGLWTAIYEAGGSFDITPYGTETMHVLRAEKGFVIVGQDTDGSVTPGDLKMGWMLSKSKDFIGRRSLARPDSRRKDRKQLVGLLSVDGRSVLPEGGQITEDAPIVTPMPLLGHVTSSYSSATLGHPIALALLVGGRKRRGDRLLVHSAKGEIVPVEVTGSVFYDPKGARQNV